MVAVSSSSGRSEVVTAFGTVTDRQVTYYRKKGWFSGGSREDLPLRHVTSVRLETSRHPVVGIVLLLSALGFFAAGGELILVALVPLAIAVLMFWGSPKVIVNTAGNDLSPATGFPWTRADAEEFVNALRAQLFRD